MNVRKMMMVAATLCGAFAGTVGAQTPTATFNIATLTWSSGSAASNLCGWDGAAQTLTVSNNANIAVTGAVGGRRIQIATNATANVTLNNVSLSGLGGYQAALMVSSNATLNLTLSGVNELTSSYFCAGIQTTRATLVITAASTGSLIARGDSSSAGIGGSNGTGMGTGYGNSSGTIIINGGTVTAYGGGGGAGIGGGWHGAGDTITINGGTIEATGGSSGAGIGGGSSGAGGTITINGGTVSATGGAVNDGTGIGGGNGGAGGTITINGGTVNATGGGIGAGIGAGLYGMGGTFGMYGNAVVYASPNVRDASAKANGVLFTNGVGMVYGSVILAEPFTNPALHTLTIPAGAVLAVPTFTNDGTLHEFGKLIIYDLPPTVAPSISGGDTAMTVTAGYAKTSTAQFTLSGDPAPTVEKVFGDSAITWSDTMRRLDIATGLKAGVYPVVLRATNGTSPDAVHTFTLTVNPTPPPTPPTIEGKNEMRLTVGYAPTCTQEFTVTGGGTVTVTLLGGFEDKLEWDEKGQCIFIAKNIPAGVYPVILVASNGSYPDAVHTFTLFVDPAPPPAPPAILNAPASMTLQEGYAATTTTTFSFTGDGATIGKIHGNSAITLASAGGNRWLSIAAGLGAGVYPVVLRVSNATTPDAVHVFTLTVLPAPEPGYLNVSGFEFFNVGGTQKVRVRATGGVLDHWYEVFGMPTFAPFTPGIKKQADTMGEVIFEFDKPAHGTYFFKVRGE